MIIEKHTQRSDLIKPTGTIKTTYTVEPETPKELMEFENFINYNKIPKITLDNFVCNGLYCKAARGEL